MESSNRTGLNDDFDVTMKPKLAVAELELVRSAREPNAFERRDAELLSAEIDLGPRISIDRQESCLRVALFRRSLAGRRPQIFHRPPRRHPPVHRHDPSLP